MFDLEITELLLRVFVSRQLWCDFKPRATEEIQRSPGVRKPANGDFRGERAG
jgi:hypothetical protein